MDVIASNYVIDMGHDWKCIFKENIFSIVNISLGSCGFFIGRGTCLIHSIKKYISGSHVCFECHIVHILEPLLMMNLLSSFGSEPWWHPYVWSWKRFFMKINSPLFFVYLNYMPTLHSSLNYLMKVYVEACVGYINLGLKTHFGSNVPFMDPVNQDI